MLGWLLDAFGLSRFARLSKQATSPDSVQRTEAATGLAEPRAVPLLMVLFADPEPSVREAAAASLVQLGPAASPALLDALKDHREAVAIRATETLLPSPEAATALLHALKYAPRPVQLAAHRALVRFGPVAVAALEAARDEPQPWVRGKIEEALAALRGSA